MLLVGSKALQFFGTQFITPGVNRTWDNDWVSTYNEFISFKKLNKTKNTNLISKKYISTIVKNEIHEFEIAWQKSSARDLLELAKNNKSVAFKYKDYYIATPDLVFTLKKSHRFLRNSPHFIKTMLDYNHLKSIGCSIPESLKEWYKKREKETYWYSHPNLNVSKDEFFKTDIVPYIYDHDTLHLSVAHLDKPAYEYFKKDNAEVNCSKELFEQLPEYIKLYAVLEEAYVLALERSQIPAPGIWTPRKSFEYALFKVASSITSGFFREYAYNNYFKVLNMYSESYIDRFQKGLKTGLVKKI